MWQCLFSGHCSLSGLTECDCKPSDEWRGVHRGQPAGRDRSLYVRPSGHGDSGWREGELTHSLTHTRNGYFCVCLAECLTLLCRLTCTSWPSLRPVNGCTSTRRWLTAAAASRLSSPKINVWASGFTQSKWWSGEIFSLDLNVILLKAVAIFSQH